MKHITKLSESPCYQCEMEEVCSAKVRREPKLQDTVLSIWLNPTKKKKDCVMYQVLKMEGNNATASR